MTQPDEGVPTMIATDIPNLPPDEPIIIDGGYHRHYRQEFRFEGSGFFGRILAAILNWMRRNCD